MVGGPADRIRGLDDAGWALVGDAGHWMDPAGMHGMTDVPRRRVPRPGSEHDQLGAQQPGEDDLVTAGHLTAAGGG